MPARTAHRSPRAAASAERSRREIPPRPDTSNFGPNDRLTIEEVAGYNRVAIRTVRDWINAGDLRAYKVGRQLRFYWRDVLAHGDKRASLPERVADATAEALPTRSGPR